MTTQELYTLVFDGHGPIVIRTRDLVDAIPEWDKISHTVLLQAPQSGMSYTVFGCPATAVAPDLWRVERLHPTGPA